MPEIELKCNQGCGESSYFLSVYLYISVLQTPMTIRKMMWTMMVVLPKRSGKAPSKKQMRKLGHLMEFLSLYILF